MKNLNLIISVLLLSIFSGINLLNAQTTYIQVVSEPGVSVYLDNTFKGRTTADIGGLIIENVTPGSRLIKVVKDGFNPQEDRITVRAGEVYTHKVRPFVPKIKIEQTGSVGEQKMDLRVGRLKIQSLPVSINISIPILGVNSTKTQDEWMANEIPVGSYEATFTWQGKSIKHLVEVRQNQETHLFVNMMQLNVELRSFDASKLDTGSFTDPRDGKKYKTINISNQVWMAENLNYYTSSGSWCSENNISNCETYGSLYDWETARNVCPLGWHLPSEAEWDKLINTFGGYEIAGLKMKSTTGWTYNGNGNNESGFSGLPGGSANINDGPFGALGNYGYWWSSTERSLKNGVGFGLAYGHVRVVKFDHIGKTPGHSVRCVKD